MTEYNFLQDYCSKCHKKTECVEIYDKKGRCQSLCEMCIGWSMLVDASSKDDISEIFCGIEDLEPIHDKRDLD